MEWKGVLSDSQKKLLKKNFGLKASRGCCTDILFLLIFLLGVAAYTVVIIFAFENGNPLRLIYGTDYLGNICGKTGKDNAPRQPMPDEQWRELEYLWYPFDEFMDLGDLRRTLDLGVCVAECPQEGDLVDRYLDPEGNIGKNLTEVYTVVYDSDQKLRRCVPLSANSTLGEKVQDIVDLLDVTDLFFEGVAAVDEAQTTVAASLGVAFLASMVWLLLMYLFALPLLIVSIAALTVVGEAGGYYLIQYADDMQADDDDDQKYVRGLGYTLMIVAGLFFLTCLCLWKQIYRGATMVRKGSKALASVPSMVVVPLLFTTLVLGVMALGVATLLYIQTMTTHSTENFSWGGEDVEALAGSVPTNKKYLHAYNIFFTLWAVVFLQDTGYLCIALVSSFWYFSKDANGSRGLFICSPLYAIFVAFTHHLGTTAFGSLIITICKAIRFVLLRMKERLTKLDGYAKCILKVAACCLWCLENVLSYLSEKAYVMTAIEGTNFCSSARHAIMLIAANFVSVIAVDIVVALMVLIGKLFIVVGTTLFAWYAFENLDLSPDVDSYWVPLILIAVMAYMVCTLYVKLFATVVDSLLLCYLVDKEFSPPAAAGYYDSMGDPSEDIAREHWNNNPDR